MNADGSEPRNLTKYGRGDVLPAWSPDGKKIAFMSFRDRNAEIYVMRADGSGQKRLTHNAGAGNTGLDYKPAWSPDGKKIAFTSWRNFNSEIYVMNADGSRERNLTRHRGNVNNGGFDDRPAWSPDGKKIAFSSSRNRNNNYNDEIYVMNANGTGQTRITRDVRGDLEPDWQTLP